jgi:addiction module HigA family antidote
MMYDPPHPGEIIREDCITVSDLSVTEAAERLGVTRQALSAVLNGRADVSVEMALRLERMGWSTAETWLGVQQAYDLWQARRRKADTEDAVR